MPFVPQQPDEALRFMQARAVASSKRLTDMSEGGVLGTLLGAPAEDIASAQEQLRRWRNSHWLEAVGADLDDRVAQLPKQFPRRRGPRPASGGRAVVTRASTTGSLVLAPGALVVGRTDQENTLYTNVNELSYADGVPSVSEVALRALQRGRLGNGEPGVVNVVRSPVDTIRSVVSTTAMVGGSDGESDPELRRRARAWVSGLMGWTVQALEALAINFTDSNGDIFTHARAVTDPLHPGYVELVVSDELGLEGLERPALERSGTVPTLVSGTRYQFPFDYPAVGSVKLTLDGTTYGPSTTDWIALLERGLLITNYNTSVPITSGMAWSISGHKCFSGKIAEFQEYVDEVAVGAGLRVRVVPPIRKIVSLSANVVPRVGGEREAVFEAVKNVTVAFVANLGPGEPLYMAKLYGALDRVAGIENIQFDQGDRYPGDLRHKLVTSAAHITLR